jgi:hypothetical protein
MWILCPFSFLNSNIYNWFLLYSYVIFFTLIGNGLKIALRTLVSIIAKHLLNLNIEYIIEWFVSVGHVECPIVWPWSASALTEDSAWEITQLVSQNGPCFCSFIYPHFPHYLAHCPSKMIFSLSIEI